MLKGNYCWLTQAWSLSYVPYEPIVFAEVSARPHIIGIGRSSGESDPLGGARKVRQRRVFEHCQQFDLLRSAISMVGYAGLLPWSFRRALCLRSSRLTLLRLMPNSSASVRAISPA